MDSTQHHDSDNHQQLEQCRDIKVVEEYTNGQGYNIKSMLCPKCSSIILKPNFATLHIANSENIKNITTITDNNHTDTSGELAQPDDALSDTLWLVDNMLKFENLGFSHTVNESKYLCCADCELGPLGWHNISTKHTFVHPRKVAYR